MKPLTLEDRPIFLAAARDVPLVTSDVNFSNMFIWRSYYRFEWEEAQGCLCVMARLAGQEPFGMTPLGAGDRLAAMRHMFQNLGLKSIRRVPEELARQAEAAGFSVEADPDNDDYIYSSEKLITLSGRRMHQKKNHYNHFVNNYKYECLDIDASLTPELIAVEDAWLLDKEAREEADPAHMRYEIESVHELLRHAADLEQVGLAIRIGGKIEAFTMGERMSPDTALIHLEKANPAMRGLYVALCSHFCARYFADVPFINREQDLGLPGLRQSKESLKPDHMRHKFFVRP